MKNKVISKLRELNLNKFIDEVKEINFNDTIDFRVDLINRYCTAATLTLFSNSNKEEFLLNNDSYFDLEDEHIPGGVFKIVKPSNKPNITVEDCKTIKLSNTQFNLIKNNIRLSNFEYINDTWKSLIVKLDDLKYFHIGAFINYKTNKWTVARTLYIEDFKIDSANISDAYDYTSKNFIDGLKLVDNQRLEIESIAEYILNGNEM